MDLLFKATLSNDIAGDLQIKEPEGWDDARLNLERNQKFHSLVESYRQPLTFDDAQSSAGLTGGMQYIKDIESTQGPDAIITLTIEISEDGGDTYEVCFEGTLDFDTLKEIDFYKLQCGVKRDDFWSKFINRQTTPVNLLSTTDLDGNERDVIDPVNIPLPSQAMRELFAGAILTQSALTEEDRAYSLQIAINPTASDNIQIGFDVLELNEIKEFFTLPSYGETDTQNVTNLFTMKYAGTYRFVLRVVTYGWIGGPENETAPDANQKYYHTNTSMPVYIQFGDDSPIMLSYENFSSANGIIKPTSGEDLITDVTVKWTVWELDQTYELKAGTEVRIYGDITTGDPSGGADSGTEAYIVQGGGSDENIYVGYQHVNMKVLTGFRHPTYLEITADTIAPDTETEGFLIHEAGNAITDRIIGRDRTFYSEYLGNPNTQIQNYSETGCGSNYALARGLNVRGYSLADKPFFMSFDTWWMGINPILNLGLGYEISANSPEEKIIRVEPKRYFYDPVPSLLLDYVNNIERSYDTETIIKSIEMGYEKWSAESNSGVDDPQSKRVYSTRFKTVGKDVKILSKFIAASLAIEQTRRNRVEQGKDWRLDEEVMIISVNLTGSPEYQPERDENFSLITDLLNSETRYNIRLSVARNFKRWLNYFNGCMQWYASLSPAEQFKFASGEGNFDMVSSLISGDCESGQSGDFVVLDALADAVNLGTGTNWSIDASPSVTVSSGLSKYLAIGLTGTEAGVNYSFTVDFTIISGNPTYVKAFLLDSGGNVISSTQTLSEGENTFTLSGTDVPAYLAIEAYRSNVNPATVQIDSAVINVVNIDPVDESGNIDSTDDFLFMPIVYEFDHPLSYEQYKTIRDNRTKAIGISRSNDNHKACFIMDMEYQITKGLATFKVALGENDPLI